MCSLNSSIAQKKLIVYSDGIYDSQDNVTYANSKIVFDLINLTYQRTTDGNKFPKYDILKVYREWLSGEEYTVFDVSGSGKTKYVLVNDNLIIELYTKSIGGQSFHIKSTKKE